MTRPLRASRGIAAAVLAFALVVCLGVPAAYAAMEDPVTPVGTSTTNPGNGADAWWRQGWGKDLYPTFNLNLPPMVEATDGFLAGMIYTVDRTQGTVLNIATPGAYYRSTRPVGTTLAQSLDMPGVVAYPPFVGQSVEGQWYLHFNWFSSLRYSFLTRSIAFGIDQTPPALVTGFKVGPANGVPGVPDTWYASRRAHLTWNAGPYDALSGDGYYQIRIDGELSIPESTANPVQGRVYSLPGLPNSVTIENMPPGAHSVSISVVDRATNEGDRVSTTFNSDSDVPTITVSVPPITGTFATIIASPFDAGGIQFVDFYIDGTEFVGRVRGDSGLPYTARVDMTGRLSGTHTFSATVTDMMGRTATASNVSVTDPASAFRTGIVAVVQGVSYPDANGQSPLRYFSTRSISVSLSASRTVDGFAYLLSRSSATLPSMPPTAGDPPTAMLGVGTTPAATASGNLDLASWQSVQTSPRELTPGLSANPLEGVWYLTAKAMLSTEFPPLSSTLRRVKFIIDLTPPLAPTGLQPSGGLPTSIWSPSARMDFQWNNPAMAGLTQYDALSGDAYYSVTLNGVEIGQSKAIGALPLNYWSIENLPAGMNRLGVAVVDNAGNHGAEAFLNVLVDPDVPTIVNTTAAHVGRYATLTSTPADLGGVASVAYTVDGIAAGTARTAPWSVTVDMLALGRGVGGHTIVATVTDLGGRTASDTKVTNIVSLSVPFVSGLSDTPDPFFPIRRDRYKDDMVAKFRLAKRAYVTMQIFDASGALVQSLAGWKNAGANSFTWNGRRSTGTIDVGTYTYRLVADDGQYNVITSATGVTHIKSYILVRLRRNKVKVVFH